MSYLVTLGRGLDVKISFFQLKEIQTHKSRTGSVHIVWPLIPHALEAGKTRQLRWAEEDLRPLMPQRYS